MQTSIERSMYSTCLGALLGLRGLAICGAGIWLWSLGGSAYYTFAGALLLAVGWMVYRRMVIALETFAFLFITSLIWSIWEAGLDWWPLAARMGFWFLAGVVLILPATTRRLVVKRPFFLDKTPGSGTSFPATPSAWNKSGGLAISLGLLAFVAVAIASWTKDEHKLAGKFSDQHVSGAAPAAAAGDIAPGDWHAYGRTAAGQRYSPLGQITPGNVSTLEVAWHIHTGDLGEREGDPVETTYEVTPLKIGNRLYLCNPHQSVLALDATTGKEIWRFDPKIKSNLVLQHLTCRGLSYQPPLAASNDKSVASSNLPTACPAGKLFMPTADGRLIALNPANGAVCSDFGGGKGEIDLFQNMPHVRPGGYYSTSPVAVSEKLVIVGGTVLDNVSAEEPSGVIRAYDINTGALVWNWDSGNPDSTVPLAQGEYYTASSPNSWSVSSVDEQLGMIYIPMGNQPPDQWGGKRSAAAEKYSSSVVALNLNSGKVAWVYQTVHHDLWDYDVPSQPSLVDLTIAGATVPALVQPTKQGELFVLDRRTGKPIFPQAETPAPQGAAAGDHTALTQPRAAISFNPPVLQGRDMWGISLFDQLACRIAFHRLRYEGRFTPPSTRGSLIYPGNFGVFNWGSVAVDPTRQVTFTTPTYLAFVSQLIPRTSNTALMVHPDGKPPGSLPALNENFGSPFAVKLGPFVSPIGVPCQAPPWGYVAGADLRTGKIIWKHRNGTVRDLSPLPLKIPLGVPNLGGPIMTASGVAFLSGTLDYYLRAYAVDDGRQLWESRLPAGAQATPMTYLGSDNRQYVLVVAGGHGSTGTKRGDSIIAYALPKAQ